MTAPRYWFRAHCADAVGQPGGCHRLRLPLGQSSNVVTVCGGDAPDGWFLVGLPELRHPAQVAGWLNEASMFAAPWVVEVCDIDPREGGALTPHAVASRAFSCAP